MNILTEICAVFGLLLMIASIMIAWLSLLFNRDFPYRAHLVLTACAGMFLFIIGYGLTMMK